MESDVIFTQKIAGSEFVWRSSGMSCAAPTANKPDIKKPDNVKVNVKPITAYRTVREGREVVSWINGSVAFSIINTVNDKERAESAKPVL